MVHLQFASAPPDECCRGLVAKELRPPTEIPRPGVATARPAEETLGRTRPTLRGAVPRSVPSFRDGILANSPGRWLDPAAAGEAAGKALESGISEVRVEQLQEAPLARSWAGVEPQSLSLGPSECRRG